MGLGKKKKDPYGFDRRKASRLSFNEEEGNPRLSGPGKGTRTQKLSRSKKTATPDGNLGGASQNWG